MIINFTENFARLPALLFVDACFRPVSKCFAGEIHPVKSDFLTPSDPAQSGVFWRIINRSVIAYFIIKALQDKRTLHI
jgi:hypothetical protein